MEREPLLVTISDNGAVELSQDPQVDQTTTSAMVEVQMTRHPEKPTTTEMTGEGWLTLGVLAMATVSAILINSTSKR